MQKVIFSGHNLENIWIHSGNTEVRVHTWCISGSSQQLFSFDSGDVFEEPRLAFKGLHLIQVPHRHVPLSSCFDVFYQSPAFELPVFNQLQYVISLQAQALFVVLRLNADWDQ